MYLSNDGRVRLRQELEARIIRAIAKEAFRQGYSIQVFDGEEVHKPTTKLSEVMERVMETDEDYLYLKKNGSEFGWVRLVYGNDGWDVISDYSANPVTESVLIPANKIVNKYT